MFLVAAKFTQILDVTKHKQPSREYSQHTPSLNIEKLLKYRQTEHIRR